MYRIMKTFISLFTLAAIVFAYVLSITLYKQGELLSAYSLIISSIAGFTFWIHAQSKFGIGSQHNA
jgi:hypothetical protein